MRSGSDLLAEADANGVQLVHLPKDQGLAVVVFNTHPLVYDGIRQDATEEDVPELANLQQLVSLLSRVAVAATTPALSFLDLAAPEDVQPADIVAAFRAVPGAPGLPENVRTNATELTEWAGVQYKDRLAPFNALRKAAVAAQANLGEISRLNGRVTSFLQAMELAVKPAANFPDEQEISKVFAATETTFDELQTARNAASALELPCAASVNAVAELFRGRATSRSSEASSPGRAPRRAGRSSSAFRSAPASIPTPPPSFSAASSGSANTSASGSAGPGRKFPSSPPARPRA